MDFTNAGDPPPRRIPSQTEMLAQFGQAVAVLTAPPPGARLDISGGAVDDRIWCIDIDYRVNNQLAARARTVRELTPSPAHGAPGDFLRSALIEFSVNVELAVGRPAADPDQPRGMQLTSQQEQLAARGITGDAEMTIDGTIQTAITLHIPGYRAHLARHGQTSVIYIGSDTVPIPDLQMTTTPHA